MDASNSLRVTAKRNFTSCRGFQQCIQECYEVALAFLNNLNPIIFLHYKSSSQLGQAFDDLKQKSVFPTRLEFSKLTKFFFLRPCPMFWLENAQKISDYCQKCFGNCITPRPYTEALEPAKFFSTIAKY